MSVAGLDEGLNVAGFPPSVWFMPATASEGAEPTRSRLCGRSLQGLLPWQAQTSRRLGGKGKGNALAGTSAALGQDGRRGIGADVWLRIILAASTVLFLVELERAVVWCRTAALRR